jgi:hypothetical protein
VKNISETFFDRIKKYAACIGQSTNPCVSHLLTVNSWPIHLKFRKIAREAIAQSIGTE